MTPAILLQSELVNENYIMHVFTHLNSIEISRSPQTSPSALMQNVLSDGDIWFIHADAIEETSVLCLLPPRAIYGEF